MVPPAAAARVLIKLLCLLLSLDVGDATVVDWKKCSKLCIWLFCCGHRVILQALLGHTLPVQLEAPFTQGAQALRCLLRGCCLLNPGLHLHAKEKVWDFSSVLWTYRLLPGVSLKELFRLQIAFLQLPLVSAKRKLNSKNLQLLLSSVQEALHSVLHYFVGCIGLFYRWDSAGEILPRQQIVAVKGRWIEEVNIAMLTRIQLHAVWWKVNQVTWLFIFK